MRPSLLLSTAILAASLLPAQDIAPGRLLFESRCARCHGGDGSGGDMGPPIRRRAALRSDEQLATLVHNGTGAMPPIPISDAEMTPLLAFLHSWRAAPRQAVHIDARLTTGRTLSGELLNQGTGDLQMRTPDGRVHLLRRAAGSTFREAAPGANWPGYNGDPGGNRFTTLSTITRENVTRLAPRWIFTLPGAGLLQGTPVVVDGILYIPSSNECYALDAGTGRQIWHWQVPGEKTGGTNRGVAVAGNRLFLQTQKAHLVALDRFSGTLLWDTEMADWRQSYFATSAPLTAGSLVIAGTAGGEHGARGFLAAYDQSTGREVWRFWTVPLPGQPGAETWQGKGIEHGGAPTWFTGTYDAPSGTVFWPTGNPSAEYFGDDRGGDNLYSDCILALDAKTGRLLWHYQTTPHDLWDWDAAETPIVADALWQGRPRKLLLQANRNGFFYVFDRTNGKLLAAHTFVRNLTWASGIGPDGRPVRKPNQEPSPQGTLVCPSQDGATNWYSPSFNPASGLYYVQTNERCSIYTKADPGAWQPLREYLGGSQRTAPDPKPVRILRAIEIATGKIAWQVPQPGPGDSWGGTLATSTGLVFFGAEDGSFEAADAVTGKVLWNFPTNQLWKASPMTYSFDGKQYLAVAAGPNVIAFGVE
ncbi:MAG: PQQ-binding-like beta-propeller repeat protein [Acidobacteria bacterium]|nr:PQQ-binding-like beta-propeller repeat protein [Acidobacteriota bacterium]